MKRHLLVLLIILLAVPAAFTQKRGISHDDLYNMQRLASPAISPDGTQIAFVVTVFDKKNNSSNSDIWLVSVNGGEPRRLTASPKGDSSPVWSPDGKQIAFISSRDGSSQIYTIRVNGGEAKKISDIAFGASGIIWAPDGKTLAFTSKVFPELDCNEANKEKMEKQENSKIQAKIFDRLLYRHWNEWTNDTRSHVFTIPAEGGETTDITPGDHDSPPISLGGAQDYVFSPDSREICFVKNIDPVIAVSTNNDLFVVNLSTGEHQKITDTKGNDNSPSYSPDGRYIAYTSMARPGFEADRSVLKLYDRTTKEHLSITENCDRSVAQFVWAPDGKIIYFRANDKGQVSIYAVNIESKEISQVTEGMYNRNLNISADGNTLVFLSQRINLPSEVFKCSVDGSGVEQLTFTNADLLSDLDMNPIEDFWFEGAGKTQVHGMIVRPPHFDPNKKYPMLYLVHGGPQGMWGNDFHYRWNVQLFASPGNVVIMVNPRGSTGYGQKFTDEISGDWGGKVFTDLKNGLKYAVENYDFIDPERLTTAGASYGGYMMNWFEAKSDELPYEFKCIINHDGVFNTVSMYLATEELWFPEWEFSGVPWDKKARKVYDKWSPSNYIQNFKTPMLIIHSELDYRVPIGEGLQVFTALQKMGVPSKFLYFPDEDHWIHKPQNSELWYKTIQEWIEEWTSK